MLKRAMSVLMILALLMVQVVGNPAPAHAAVCTVTTNADSGNYAVEQPADVVLLDQLPNPDYGIKADYDDETVADNFTLGEAQTITQVELWGHYSSVNPSDDYQDSFTLIFHADADGWPGVVLYSEAGVASTRVYEGDYSTTLDYYKYTLTLAEPLPLEAGVYWVEIYNDDGGDLTYKFSWLLGDSDTLGRGISGFVFKAWTSTSWTSNSIQPDSWPDDMSLRLIGHEPAAPTNTAPTADPGGPYSGQAGTSIAFDGSGSSDPDGDDLTYAWDFGDGDTGSGVTPSHTYTEEGAYDVCLTVNDGTVDSAPVCTEATIFAAPVPNTAPVADPGGPYLGAANSSIAFDGSGSSDPDGDPLTYAWDFGDGSSGTGVNPSHSYAAAGIYNVCLTVDDSLLDSDPTCTIAVVYDPSAGFVTGGGWIDSPAGAYKLDETLGGKATFGFVSKYKKGAKVPEGNTEFQFQAGGFSFHSTAYDWLVVSKKDLTAQFKGSGTVNGALDPNGSEYKFMLWAGDADPDTFRIRIWWEDADGNEQDVYDNGFNQAIGGGSIVVQAK